MLRAINDLKKKTFTKEMKEKSATWEEGIFQGIAQVNYPFDFFKKKHNKTQTNHPKQGSILFMY